MAFERVQGHASFSSGSVFAADEDVQYRGT